MSTAPEGPSGGAQVSVPKKNAIFNNCWSCRVLSGSGLLLSGAYVFNIARKKIGVGGYTSIGTVAQITFAASIAAWGIVFLVDPVGKSYKKT